MSSRNANGTRPGRAGTYAPSPIETVFESVRTHDFHPLDGDRFTIDRHLVEHGIADLSDRDWEVRLRAVRDLVRAGSEAVPAILSGLNDADVHVRYIAAEALGILRAEAGIPALEGVLTEDPDPLARQRAASALGQIEATQSLEPLQRTSRNDSSGDVRHQARLAIGQIRRRMGTTLALADAYSNLDPTDFSRRVPGDTAPDFLLPDTADVIHQLRDLRAAADWLVLIWVFADWCPVCHREFAELIELREAFAAEGVAVATLECHDTYRCRVMAGLESVPREDGAAGLPGPDYAQEMWWPHLMDRAGTVGLRYGVDPLAFAVHGEYINRPATVILDAGNRIRFAYYGTYWGDRPSIEETLDMIRTQQFDFEHPQRRIPPVG